MATMQKARDESSSLGTRSRRDVSPRTTLPATDDEASKSNGYVSSPLRTEQHFHHFEERLSSSPQPIDEAKPNNAPTASSAEPSRDSFPFGASPGTVGPLPTNELHNALSTFDRKVDQSPQSPGRKEGVASRNGTPTDHQKSVQFAEGNGRETAHTPLHKTRTWDTQEQGTESPANPRQGSFLGKLKALASPVSSSHVRASSNTWPPLAASAPLSPQPERSEHAQQTDGEAGEESDVEEDSDEPAADAPRAKRRRRPRRPQLEAAGTAPSTPMASRFASFIRDHQRSGSGSRPAGLRRRATMSDVGEDSRREGALSEDEGKDKLRSAWRKGIENARGLGSSARKQHDGETPGEKRPMNLRRLTGMGAGESGGSPFRARGDRHNSASAQRWRQVKAGLKLLGQRRRDERIRVDYQKSAQLMAEIAAGAPAALVLASFFQRDEHGHRRIPALLEQLKISIPSSQTNETKPGDRHYIFKIDLEYGSGSARLKWTLHRTLRDFVNLHLKYKVQGQTEKIALFRSDDKSKARIPHFPKSAFPYARGARGLFSGLEDEDDNEETAETNGTGGALPSAERPGKLSRGLPPHALTRRKSSVANLDVGNATQQEQRQRTLYAERQRKKLEVYLQQMIRWLIFRADSNRLCKFLELSALSIRLAAEYGYQGKQGLLSIASLQNREMRRKALTGLQGFADRHKPRWTMVRHSYIVIVDGPESLTPYDVFLVDSDFAADKRKKRLGDQTPQETAKTAAGTTATYAKHHLIRLYNAERKLKLIARNERQWLQFRESIDQMAKETVWSQKQRYASFAPVRDNVWCRWLVDGRDHMWQVSRAIDNAKDFIYIHDWWLSPELYMRRPAAISQKWRLDRLLLRKAQEGVKIFVIVYRNIESAIPIDSEYTKWALLDLHENICVQRSPNQFRQNQFFWAHHEKLVVVDNMMAFCGGVDLCFGRWDDPCHSLTDDKLTGFELDHDTPRDSEHCQMWPGKDYSNPRVQDFYALDRPYEEMYDRTKVPRMPWHDISMQIVGQPARDIGRHFVQRWNYILRQRIPSRPTPVLIPPPEYDHEELEKLGMTGSCQVQILRSASPWSMGTPNKVEHSIMNAYCDMIEKSEHFVYIENQFYISSCTVEGSPIHNKIGDALVERIVRAHRQGEKWQACLVIPLMPGFQNSVDSQDGTSVRLIMQCQYRSICRGDSSLFGRLRAVNIEPEAYIRFYSLRTWGKIGPRQCLTTEQLYIHAKCMVVDDRHAIIGSANINERSMLGSRDSEVAALVTDLNMIPSFMGGKPYMVGEFPHTLRVRLQREHLGIDVDALYRRDQMEVERQEQDAEMDHIYRQDFASPAADADAGPATAPPVDEPSGATLNAAAKDMGEQPDSGYAWTNQVVGASGQTPDSSEQPDKQHKKGSADLQHDLDVAGFGVDNERQLEAAGLVGFRDSYIDARGHEVLHSKDPQAVKRSRETALREVEAEPGAERKKSSHLMPPWPLEHLDTAQLGLSSRSQLPELPQLDDTDIGGPPVIRSSSKSSTKGLNPLMYTLHRPEVSEGCMQDPIADGFYHDVWHQVAENNTKLFRQVFRCMPDSEVLDWKTYERFNDYNERFMQSQGLGSSKTKTHKDAPGSSGPPGSVNTEPSIAEGAPDGTAGEKANVKGMLSGLVNKMRHGSRSSDVGAAQSDVTQEKRTGSPGSPGSGASSMHTAIPSPETRPLDEKDGMKPVEFLDEKAAQRAAEQGMEPGEDVALPRQRTIQIVDTNNGLDASAGGSNSNLALQQSNSQRRRRRGTKSSGKTVVEEVMSKEEAEGLLKMVQGSLVSWPYDW